MNTFLKQHGNDAIEEIQVAAVQSSRLLETEFIGIGLISFIPRVANDRKPPSKKRKAGNRTTKKLKAVALQL